MGVWVGVASGGCTGASKNSRYRDGGLFSIEIARRTHYCCLLGTDIHRYIGPQGDNDNNNKKDGMNLDWRLMRGVEMMGADG